MGTFYTEISLENVIDRGAAERGYLPVKDVRQVTLDAMPDTGAWTLVINEAVRKKLGLKLEGSVGGTLADGSTSQYQLTEAVKIKWQNRSAIMQAVLSPAAKDVLLGTLPLEAMDLMVDPVNEKLVGIHGEQPAYTLYGCR